MIRCRPRKQSPGNPPAIVHDINLPAAATAASGRSTDEHFVRARVLKPNLNTAATFVSAHRDALLVSLLDCSWLLHSSKFFRVLASMLKQPCRLISAKTTILPTVVVLLSYSPVRPSLSCFYPSFSSSLLSVKTNPTNKLKCSWMNLKIWIRTQHNCSADSELEARGLCCTKFATYNF